MRVILAKKIRNFILEKPQILSNHGTGSMSCGGGAEQEASMLKKLAVVTSSKLLTIYSVPTHRFLYYRIFAFIIYIICIC